MFAGFGTVDLGGLLVASFWISASFSSGSLSIFSWEMWIQNFRCHVMARNTWNPNSWCILVYVNKVYNYRYMYIVLYKQYLLNLIDI